jgi:hypothetical protein
MGGGSPEEKMANLNASIEALAAEFARGVLRALRGASLSDIVDLTAGGKTAKTAKGRTPRPGWPKCKTCGKNCHPRGKGYCWEHAIAAGVVKGNGRTSKVKPAKGAKAKAARASKKAGAKAK